MPLPDIPYDDWFHKPHPHDSMPIATNDRFDMYGSSECDDAYNPRPEEEIADAYASFKDAAEKGYDEVIKKEEVPIHEKMYRIATAKYNPFAIGGSESITDFGGGSEKIQS